MVMAFHVWKVLTNQLTETEKNAPTKATDAVETKQYKLHSSLRGSFKEFLMDNFELQRSDMPKCPNNNLSR